MDSPIAKGLLGKAIQSPYAACFGALIFLYALSIVIPDTSRGNKLPGVPIVGSMSVFEPAWFTKLRFTLQGWDISYRGWKKYRNTNFTIIRPESNVTVIPNKYVDELQSIMDDRLAAVEAIVADLMGKYTGIDVLVGSHLSNAAVRTRLTPRLGSFIPIIEEELNYGLLKEMPPCKGLWVSMDLNKVALHVFSRITARLFVGFPLCQNDEWVAINEDIVPEIFGTNVRLFPTFLHPVVGFCLPSRRRLQRYTKRVHELLIPVINERRHRQANGVPPEQDIITWMMELANEEEQPAENLAQRYIYTIIGSMHTVTAAVVDTIYDLCARPEYLHPLREEVEQVLNDDGGWQKGTASSMQKLDSFMKEVQRINPPSALGFKRIVKDPHGITLFDGFHLPKDTYICVPSISHLQDDVEPASQDHFDGFRYYKKRLDAGYSTKHQYSSTDKNQIHFGHGRYACPGRFVASNEIEMIVGKIILKYDLRFPKGQGRPPNKTILELSFQDPDARIMVKERS